MVWAEEFCRIFDGRVITAATHPNDDIDVGSMLPWFASAIETGRSAGMGQVVLAQTNDDGTISLMVDLDMERDVRISPQLLVQMIERHNESVQGDAEPPTLEEKFKEGFDEGR